MSQRISLSKYDNDLEIRYFGPAHTKRRYRTVEYKWNIKVNELGKGLQDTLNNLFKATHDLSLSRENRFNYEKIKETILEILKASKFK